MGKYRDAIEADLAFRGIDLGEIVRQRRVRYLLNLLDHLPRDSFYQEARSRDSELALDVYLSDDGSDPVRTPPQSYYSYTNELLTLLVNELKVLRHDVGSLAGGKPSKPDMVPRPVSALDEVERRMADTRLALMNTMLGGGARRDG